MSLGVLLIGRAMKGKFTSTNQMYNPDLGSDTSSVWNFICPFLRCHVVGKQDWSDPKNFSQASIFCALECYGLHYIADVI